MSRFRSCGPCTSCCTALYVHELNKPAGVRCEHLTDDGCGIYDKRPYECVRFSCDWLNGAGTIDDRPDRVGAVAVTENHNDGLGTGLVLYTDTDSTQDWRESRRLNKKADEVVGDGGACFIVGHGYRIMLAKPEARLSSILPTICKFDPETKQHYEAPADEWADVLSLFGQTKNPLGSESEPD